MTGTAVKKIELTNTITSHTDGAKIGFREDGMVYIQLFSETPDMAMENHRTMMSKQAAIKFIDALSAAIKYYPKKPK